MALSVVGGYVDAKYANFTVPDIKLFDVRGRLGEKFSKVKELAL